MTTVTDELLPCPFCRSQSLHVSDGVSFYVECRDCHAEGPWNDDDLGQAITAWNTRPDRQAAILEGMEIALRAAIGRLGAVDVEAALQSLNTPTGRAAILAAHTRAKALSELAEADADLL